MIKPNQAQTTVVPYQRARSNKKDIDGRDMISDGSCWGWTQSSRFRFRSRDEDTRGVESCLRGSGPHEA